MSPGTLLLILFSVTLSALAQVSFKLGVSGLAGSGASAFHGPVGLIHLLVSPGVLCGLALYGLGTLIWLAVLSRIDVSQAYPFVGIGFVLTALFGLLFLGEELHVQRLLGIVLVIGGIVVVARS